MDTLSLTRSPHSLTSSPEPAHKHKATAVIIGAGPAGLLAASVLEGRTFLHAQKCSDGMHKHLGERQPIYRTDLPATFEGRRGQTPAGQWFDSFCYDQANNPIHCLTFENNPDRKVDWQLFSSSPAGGSWHRYNNDQLTISPYAWMEIPGLPITDVKHYECVNPQRTKTDASSLRNYYQNYQQQLPAEAIHIGYTLTSASYKDSLWHLHFSSESHHHNMSCEHLLLAVGKQAPNRLNIQGENGKHVTHSTADSLAAFKKLPPGSNVLIVGTGLSAADTISHAWDHKLKVTHLVPAELIKEKANYKSTSSSKILMILQGLDKEYPRHNRVTGAMLNPASEKAYEQLIDYKLTKVCSDGSCIVTHSKTQESKKLTPHHVATLTGSHPDFSFIEGQSEHESTLCFDHNTMEVNGFTNLYIAGSCSGDWFQRFILGQSVQAAETIKSKSVPD
ncbi:NAD(P)-binding domain-containing protein [Endozoicomonas numazuensis]|uniref:FAD/NAD(P)-binding domain-containing protein n=1 Tax=Endozoicomonas numazuensis TaxID=1137799 RepID=A0A081NEQ4_9GAMM|nr:NAD(P)-binding domain-containing protein [Endozoicomonas numazuensis]KEQ16927.1 hypothetical protein GZ78_20030 [Endozoicomonas numazuensis]